MSARRLIFLGALLLGIAVLARQSFVTIDNGERGVVERFGKPVRDLLPGLHVKLPLGIERVRRVPGPERSLPMPIGYRLIDEKLGRSPSGAQKEWLTGDSNIVELKASVLYAIRDPKKYLYGASAVTDLDRYSIEPKTQDFVLRRVAEGALTEIIGRMAVTDVITSGAASIALAAEERIQRDADALDLGIEIVRFQLLESGPLASVKTAFRKVQDAKSERDQRRNRAETAAAEKLSQARRRARKRRYEAESTAERLVLEAQSRADQFLALHEAVGPVDSPAGVARQLDLIEELLQLMKVEQVPAGTPERPTIVYR